VDKREERLSESEWEYVTRAGPSTAYYWGDEIGRGHAHYWEDKKGTVPVGRCPPNPWGLHDMLGNVLEWTQDCWNEGYRDAPTDGSAWTVGDCASLVCRGNTSAARDAYETTVARFNLGFRLART